MAAKKKKATTAKKAAKKTAKTANKPAKKKSAKAATAAAAPAPAPKASAKGGKKAKVDPSGKKPVTVVSAIEKDVAALLKDYEDGNVDNAFDVVGDMAEMDEKLPKTSPLRKRFDKMYKEIVELCAEYG